MLVPALAVLLALLFETIAARADTDPEPRAHASLELDAGSLGERCASKSELEQAVQAQLGRVVFVESGTPPAVVVRVRLEERAPGRFHAAVASEVVPATAPAPSSTRELEAAGDCRALDEQLALVVALLVDADPTRSLAAPEPAPTPESPPEPPPEPPPVQDTGPVSSAPSWESRPTGPWHFGVGAFGIAGFRLLPRVAAGASVDVISTPPAWPGLRLRAMGFFPSRARAAPGASLAVTLLVAGIGVSPELGVAGAVTLSACLGVDATLLRVESEGLEGGRTEHQLGGQASTRLLAATPIGGGFRAGLEVATSFPFHTASFTVDRDGQREELYRTPFVPALCLRVAADYRKKARVRCERTMSEPPDTALGSTQLEEVDARRAESRLLAVLDELDDGKRDVFVLFEIGELTLREISEATDTPLQTLYSRLQAARTHVRDRFSTYVVKEGARAAV